MLKVLVFDNSKTKHAIVIGELQQINYLAIYLLGGFTHHTSYFNYTYILLASFNMQSIHWALSLIIAYKPNSL